MTTPKREGREPEPECDVCDDSREIIGWDEPKIPYPFCTLVLLPEDDDA